jgi:hypothetical protein
MKAPRVSFVKSRKALNDSDEPSENNTPQAKNKTRPRVTNGNPVRPIFVKRPTPPVRLTKRIYSEIGAGLPC